jgi:hypothetical protein
MEGGPAPAEPAAAAAPLPDAASLPPDIEPSCAELEPDVRALGGAAAEALSREPATALAASERLLALGTAGGGVTVCDHSGRAVRRRF